LAGMKCIKLKMGFRKSGIQMRAAIPFEIHLYRRETERFFIPPEEHLAQLTAAYPDAEIDKELGKRKVLARMQEMLDKGTPEEIVRGLPAFAEQSTFVAVRWADWPNNRVSALFGGIEDGPLRFSCETHDFEFLKFAAAELGGVFKMNPFLKTPYGDSVKTESRPAPFDALGWIRDYYVQMARCGATYDPKTNTFLPHPIRIPTLVELSNWTETLHRGLCHFLYAYRRCNSEAMTQGFASFEEYATAYVKELGEFAPVQHCWSVELDETDHINEVLIDQGQWLTRIDLTGVPKRILS